MTPTRTFIILALAIAQLLGVAPSDMEAPSASPKIRAIDANSNEEARLASAVELFDKNGLSLPSTDVHFFDDKSSCRGHYGLFETSVEPWRIRICSDLAFVLPHELAHAWAEANVSDTDRIAYFSFRGLTNWNDKDVAWDERGTEDAAFMIQQNIMSNGPVVMSRSMREKAKAYELLTGLRSPLR